MSLEEAKKRADRLRALREKYLHKEEDEAKEVAGEEKECDAVAGPADAVRDEQNDVAPQPRKTFEEEVREQFKDNTVNDLTDDLEISSLRARKPDWDLKRNIEKKLNRLEKRTRRCIAELIRERVAESKTSDS